MTETATPEAPANPAAEAGQYEDYWGSDSTEQWFLPDGKQYMIIKPMNEGARKKFQSENNSDMKLNRRDDTASIKLDQARERHALIKSSVVGWNMFRGGEVVDFAPRILENWLEVADPKIVDDLEFAIRKANPWMQADMTIEAIDEEVNRLNELRKQKVDEELGKASSPSS